MREVTMIRRTVRRVGRQIEQLVERGISLSTAFDILARKAGSIEEIVVVEVMREIHSDMAEGPGVWADYVESSTRSARMPSIALSR